MSKKKMDIEEFVEFGYLQEANRRFFHPLGLQLEVKMGEDDEDQMVLNGIWDKRSEEAGLLLDEVDMGKAQRVGREMKAHRRARRALPECDKKGTQKVPRG